MINNFKSGQLYINGLWVDGTGEKLDSICPVTQQCRWSGLTASKIDVDTAITEARTAFVSWKKTSLDDRKAIVRRFAELLGQNKEHLADFSVKD